jgi:hypothetical protein
MPLFNKPIWKDWIVYLWLFATWAVVAPTIQDYPAPRTPEDNLALTIDIAIAVVVQTLVFLLLPAVIRRAVRKRRNAEKAPTP